VFIFGFDCGIVVGLVLVYVVMVLFIVWFGFNFWLVGMLFVVDLVLVVVVVWWKWFWGFGFVEIVCYLSELDW